MARIDGQGFIAFHGADLPLTMGDAHGARLPPHSFESDRDGS